MGIRLTLDSALMAMLSLPSRSTWITGVLLAMNSRIRSLLTSSRYLLLL